MTLLVIAVMAVAQPHCDYRRYDTMREAYDAGKPDPCSKIFKERKKR